MWRYLALVSFIISGCNFDEKQDDKSESIATNGNTSPKPRVFDQKTIAAYETNLLNKDPVALDPANVHQWHGLVNISNTCFMNSALKLMARQNELFDKLKDITGENQEKANLRRAFKAVISMIRLGKASPANTGNVQSDNDLREYALHNLRERMKEVTSTNTLMRFTTCSQEDSDEFYTAISGFLDFNEQTPTNLMITLLADRASDADNKLSNARFSPTPEPLVVSLALDKDYNTEDLIAKFIAQRTDNALTKSFFQKDYLYNLADSLIMVVKTVVKDADGNDKIREFMTNPQGEITLWHLNGTLPNADEIKQLNDQVYGDAFDQNLLPKNTHQKKYQLAAVTVHSGSPHGGHYWAYVKDANGSWYKQDDNGTSLYKAGPLGDIEQRHGSAINPQVNLYLYEAIP